MSATEDFAVHLPRMGAKPCIFLLQSAFLQVENSGRSGPSSDLTECADWRSGIQVVQRAAMVL